MVNKAKVTIIINMLTSIIILGLYLRNNGPTSTPITTIPAYTREPSNPNYSSDISRDFCIFILAE